MEPTVGRIVHFYPGSADQQWTGPGPLAAIIAAVHSPELVNLGIFDGYGSPIQRTSVPFGNPNNGNSYWEWPPISK